MRFNRLGVLCCALLLVAAVPVGAQSVDIANGSIIIRDTVGDPEGVWIGDDLTLGGATWDGDIVMRYFDGSTIITLDATSGDMVLGGPLVSGGLDGDITLRNTSGTTTGRIDGQSGNFTNTLAGNGLVKAWAQINADGSVAACWNCNTSATETGILSTGTYEVDFTVATDLADRPVLCSAGNNTVFGSGASQIYCVQRGTDPSSIFVVTRNSTGAATDSPFTAIVF